MHTWQLGLILLGALTLNFLGLRFARPALTLAGFLVAAAIAFGHLTARFGLEQIWFRAPTFYAAAGLTLLGVAWWLRRPTPLAFRLGTLAAAVALSGLTLSFMLFNGRGAPPAMLMPTLSRAAPDITYLDATGNTRRLSDLKGDVVLINFWATWCAPCRREMPLLAKMQREYEPRRFRVLYLSLEDPETLAAFRKAHTFDGIQGRLDAAPPFYDAGKFYPLSYLVSRNGEIVARWSGRPSEDWLSERIERQL